MNDLERKTVQYLYPVSWHILLFTLQFFNAIKHYIRTTDEEPVYQISTRLRGYTFLYCIVFGGEVIAAQCTATFFKIYCAPPNLVITRT